MPFHLVLPGIHFGDFLTLESGRWFAFVFSEDFAFLAVDGDIVVPEKCVTGAMLTSSMFHCA